MYIYRLVFVLVLVIYILSPNILDWWLAPGDPWFRPFLIWAALIVTGFWLEWRRDANEF